MRGGGEGAAEVKGGGGAVDPSVVLGLHSSQGTTNRLSAEQAE